MPKRYLNNDYHDGKAFILLTKVELEKANQANSAPILKKGTPAYSDSSYSVYVFDSHQTLLDHRSNLLLLCTTHGDSKLEDTAIVMKPGSFISGPYLKKMPARDYRLQVSCQLKNAADLTLKIQDNGKLIASYPLSEGTNEYPFTLEEPSASMEFIVVNSGKSEIILERMELPDYDWFNP